MHLLKIELYCHHLAGICQNRIVLYLPTRMSLAAIWTRACDLLTDTFLTIGRNYPDFT